MNSRLAYIFYATDYDYALSALVAINRLKELGAGPGIDFVLLHLALPKALLSKIGEFGIETREVGPLRFVHGRYFRDSLVKLRLFECVEYDRVVFMDADTLPLKNIDHLFEIPLEGEIAAPPGVLAGTAPCDQRAVRD